MRRAAATNWKCTSPPSAQTRIDHLAVGPDRPRTADRIRVHSILARGVCAAGHCGERACARQSTLAPDALTTSAHFGISDFTYARSSLGVPPTTSMPRSVRALRTGGSLTVAAGARCRVAVDPFGGPAGATSACQVVASKPGKPDSAMVGTSGNTAVRLSVVIASARIVPLWM